MVKIKSIDQKYQCYLDNGQNIIVDIPSDKGGSGSGIRPYELLEAALASCMNISLRMQAEKEGIELEKVETTVSVNRNINGKTIFEYECTILDELDKQTIERIKSILQNCLIRKILSNQIEFEETSLNY
jgi:putative redox protein